MQDAEKLLAFQGRFFDLEKEASIQDVHLQKYARAVK
jgi:hypothetical protein